MKRLLKLRTLLGIFLIILAIWPQKPRVDIALINIERPNQDIVELVKPISSIVTDPTDRAKLAIFNQSFANRVKKYNAQTQQVNDVYVLAGSEFFKDTLVDKYKDLDKLIINLIEKAVGPDNHVLTTQEKDLLSSYFMGLSWSLIQRK